MGVIGSDLLTPPAGSCGSTIPIPSSMPTFVRPGADEYAPYYERYVSLVPDGDLLATLTRQGGETVALLRSLPDERGMHRYAPEKWSINDVVLHLADAERVFGYRALTFARGDRTPLPSFEHDDWVVVARADGRRLPDLVDEFEQVRKGTLALLRGLDDEAIARRGTASGKEVTARALAWIIAGHERHHVAILRERYLAG